MIVLDTNVISEVSKPEPDNRVLQWFGILSKRKVAVTAVSVGEIWAGIALMPDGARKQRLIEATQGLLHEVFGGRVLPFDYASTTHYGLIKAARSAAGRPVDRPDAQIAAICASRGLTLATRNIKDFEGTGIDLVNPWGD